MTEQQMPAKIYVWNGPGSGWNDVPILNGIRAKAYVRADIAERMAEALEHVAVLGHGKCTIGKPLAEMTRSALSAFKDSAQDRGAS